MYVLGVVISSNYSTRVHLFTDTGWSWSVPSYSRAIDWRHHLVGVCQPDSVASLMRTDTGLTAKLLVNRHGQHRHGKRTFLAVSAKLF